MAAFDFPEVFLLASMAGVVAAVGREVLRAFREGWPPRL